MLTLRDFLTVLDTEEYVEIDCGRHTYRGSKAALDYMDADILEAPFQYANHIKGTWAVEVER